MPNTMSSLKISVLFLALCFSLLHAKEGLGTEKIYLWEKPADGSEGTTLPDRGDGKVRVTDITIPTLHYFPAPEADTPTPSVILCPGGGYKHLVVSRMQTIAEWFNEHGISAFILQYRAPFKRDEAYADLQRSVRIVRAHAEKWNLDPKKIGVMGSSAGGHLTARVNTGYETPAYEKGDAIDEVSSQPNFNILLYPAYMNTGEELSPEFTLPKDLSPTLIITAADDTTWVKGSHVYEAALKEAGASVRFHLFKEGGHGFGLKTEVSPLNTWPDLCLQWMKDMGLYEGKETALLSPGGGKVIFFGDSITQAATKPGGYISLMQEKIKTSHPKVELVGAGVGGNKVGDLQRRLERDVLSHDPDLVVIFIGTNDVWHWEKPHPVTGEPREGTTPQDYERGLRELIRKIRATGAKTILSTPAVIGESLEMSNAINKRLDAYVDLCREVSRETETPLIDMRKAFRVYLATHNEENMNHGVLTSDTVHLNDAGNELVAQKMMEGLKLAEKAEPLPTPTEELHLYLLIGQSNMAGRAPLGKGHSPLTEKDWLLNDQDQWEHATAPLNRYSSVRKDYTMQRTNMGEGFLKALRKGGAEEEIGLIVNARGGSRIQQWQKGEPLYEEALRRAKIAQKKGTLRGVLWHQGESDADQPENHLENLLNFIKDLRSDLGNESLPFIVGEIGKGENKDADKRVGIKEINAQLSRLPESLPSTAFVQSADLTTMDGTHFNAESTLILGERYAEAFLQMEKN